MVSLSPSHTCFDGQLMITLGFAVVGEYQDSSIKDAQATAYDQMLDWLEAH